jgi:integrase
MAKQHDLTQVGDRNIILSLLLQEHFGLRKQESLLFQPHKAYQPAKEGREDRIFIQGSWAKGGKERWVPIVNQSQRQFLDYLLTVFKPGESMIPQHLTLKQQINIYDYQTRKVGMHKMHGLRYAYAQSRNFDLLGFPCPAQGGPSLRQLPPEQRHRVKQARLQISRELGHEREDVVLIYLGSQMPVQPRHRFSRGGGDPQEIG